MEPVNFQFADPSAAILNGIKTGAFLQDRQQAVQAQQIAQQQAMQQQMDLQRLATNPNATHADYARVMTQYPALAENLGRAFKVLDDGQQQNLLNFQSRVYSAQLSGNNELATQLLRERSKADPANQQHYDMLADMIEKSPAAARSITALGLAGALGPEKFAAAFQNLGTEARADQLQPLAVAEKTGQAQEALAKGGAAQTRVTLENANLTSQIGERAGRLALDRDKLTSEVQLRLTELQQKAGTLPDDARKIVNDATVASVAAEQSAGQMTDLADRLEKEGGGFGAFGTAAEWVKGATGNQGAMTQMRQEYVRLRNSAALKMLPPGPASDKDIQVAMKGFPPETADAAYLASFLRGMAKMQQRDAVAEGARAEWVNAVGHSGKPKTDIAIDGVQVPAGTSFTDFARTYIPQAMQRREQQQVQQRSYFRFANPPAGGASGGATGSY